MHLITTISRGGAENQLLVLVKEQIRQGLEVHVVYLKGLPELRTELESLGVIVHSELAGAHFIRQTFLLRKIVVGKNAIVHAHLPRSELVAFFSPVSFTFFVTRHNAEPFFPGAPKFLSNSLSKMVSMRCKNFIAISAAVKSFMINRGEIFNPEKIQIVRYGYEQKRNLDAGVGVPTSPLLKLGTVSRLTDQKDIHTMLRAFKLVERKIPDHWNLN
jgi:glycosyltransferase involved in cell wall biosynthesis